MSFMRSDYRLNTWVAILLLAPVIATAAEPRAFRWEAGHLRGPEKPPAVTARILQLVNAEQFAEALEAISQFADASPRLRGTLGLAVAGHLANDNPGPALQLSKNWLQQAIADDDQDRRARRLLNELDVFQTLDAVVLPWAPNLAGHSWVPAPQLLPARDMVRDGNLQQGRERIAALKGAAPRTYLLTYWQLAAFFENQPEYAEAFAVLVADLEQALTDVRGRGDEEDQRAAASLGRLLQDAKTHDWASLAVPSESLLYPRAMLEPMRAYYWWWKQMGASQRPMSKQGFDEIISGQQQRFPDSAIVKIYTGGRVPWDAPRRSQTHPGAPAWAVDQSELRARIDHVVRWWFEVRQEADGQLGGGWEDDVESLRRFSQSALLTGGPSVVAGVHRLAAGVWDQGLVVNGFDRELKDIEHSSEMSADTSVLVALDYGNPEPVERCMQTVKTIDEVHFGTNRSGRRQFRSMVLSATEVSAGDNQAFDVLYSGRAMRPVAMLAWYSQHPRAVKLLVDWSRTWSEAAVREADGKPAGIFPAAIHFGDERLNGNKTWWDPGMGELYSWKPQDLDMVWAKILLAYQLTGDATLLRGVHAQLDILRHYQGKQIENPEPGSLDWAGMQLQNHLWLARWYRSYTGRSDYDDLIAAGGGYGRFQISGDLQQLGGIHAGPLTAMRFNLPMLTTEVRGTDRINLLPFSLMGPMSGAPVSITQAPSFAVTWRNVTADFAAVVGARDQQSLVAWVYTGGDQEQPFIHFWQLQPGRYRLERMDDRDGDGIVDDVIRQTVLFDHRERMGGAAFTLPGRTLCQLRITQHEAFAVAPQLRADLAIGGDDLRLLQLPGEGRPGKAVVTVHNIGAAAVRDAKIVVVERSLETGATHSVLERTIGGLPAPRDLTSQQRTVEFQWSSQLSGAVELQVRVDDGGGEPEISTQNNRRTIPVSAEALKAAEESP
ncbi:MAG: hypothetical protein CMJ75_21810 [Planctomycetaceae bacterium]|nr:hypothetical protein [Planctomycetaceae bacterium]